MVFIYLVLPFWSNGLDSRKGRMTTTIFFFCDLKVKNIFFSKNIGIIVLLSQSNCLMEKVVKGRKKDMSKQIKCFLFKRNKTKQYLWPLSFTSYNLSSFFLSAFYQPLSLSLSLQAFLLLKDFLNTETPQMTAVITVVASFWC